VAGKLIDEEHQASRLTDPEDIEDSRTEIEELRCERRALPVALVEPAAEVGPLADVRWTNHRHGFGSGTEERDGEGRGLARHLDGFAAQGLDGVPGGAFGEVGTGLEVLDCGFP